MRMHRVVQEVVRERMGTGRADTLRDRSLAHAQTRAEEIQDTWTDREARWELTPLLRTAEAALEAEHPDAPHWRPSCRPLCGAQPPAGSPSPTHAGDCASGAAAPSSTGLASNYSNLA